MIHESIHLPRDNHNSERNVKSAKSHCEKRNVKRNNQKHTSFPISNVKLTFHRVCSKLIKTSVLNVRKASFERLLLTTPSVHPRTKMAKNICISPLLHWKCWICTTHPNMGSIINDHVLTCSCSFHFPRICRLNVIFTHKKIRKLKVCCWHIFPSIRAYLRGSCCFFLGCCSVNRCL